MQGNIECDMEQLDVFDCSNVFIASYFTDDRGCAHCNREHTLIYLCSGELEITEQGHTTVLHSGECAFMRRDNQLWLQKRVKEGYPYRSIVLKFSRDFLREFYHKLSPQDKPQEARRDKSSLWVFPQKRIDVRSLFESVIPYFDAGEKPSEEILKLKMTEGIYAILHTNVNLYASLFDFADPWKIDIMEFMEKNYMNELSMDEIALYTGRSISTFKRDFKKCSKLSPQKWLVQRRLIAARDLIRRGRQKVSEICFDVGFKNLSHFSKVYKEAFGVSPTEEVPIQA